MTLSVLAAGHCRRNRYDDRGKWCGIDDLLARQLGDWWHRKRVLPDGFEKGFDLLTDVEFELPEGMGVLLSEPERKAHGLSVRSGRMLLREGYWWDGASGPTVDTPDTLLASLFHDAAYSMIRLGWFREECAEEARKRADDHFASLLKRAGVPRWRRWLWYQGVRLGGKSAARMTESGELSERDRAAFARWMGRVDRVATPRGRAGWSPGAR